MHKHCQNPMKTSELEDQYAVIFSLAVWPEEPREIDFFKKSWFSQNMFVRKCQKSSKLSWNGSRIEMTGSDFVCMELNDLTKRSKAFPGPGEAICDQF